MQGVFNPNILIYHPPNSTEGLHFSFYSFFVLVYVIFVRYNYYSKRCSKNIRDISFKNRDHANIDLESVDSISRDEPDSHMYRRNTLQTGEYLALDTFLTPPACSIYS